MELKVVLELLKILKGNKDLYSKVDAVFESGTLDEEVGRELWEEARGQGVVIELDELLDELDDFLQNGINGMSVKALGGLSGMMLMAENMAE